MPQGAKILIVEDNDELRLDLGDMFVLEGYEVHLAPSASAALDLMERTAVDAVVSDYEMPSMTGGEFLQRLRASNRTSSLPFVLISGGLPPLADGDPFFCFLRKPFSIEDLLSVTHALIVKRRRGDYHAAD